MIIWASVLMLYDFAFNTHLRPHVPSGKYSQPQIRLWVNMMCCSGCFSDVDGAFKSLPWAAKPKVVQQEKLLTQEEANRARARSSYGSGIRVEVLDNKVELVDFVQLVQALRSHGMVPGEIELGGLPHFSLKAEVGHMCCSLCQNGAKDEVVPKALANAVTTLPWMDSMGVSREGKSITAHVRFGYAADVAEFMRTLDKAGFAATSIRVLVGQ